MNYTKQDIRRGELSGFFGFAAAILFALLLTWVSGCGSNIPLPGEEPTCEEQVTDECVPEVISAFCTSETDISLREIAAMRIGYQRGQRDCSEYWRNNPPTCDEPIEECDESVPPGHRAKDCRGARGGE